MEEVDPGAPRQPDEDRVSRDATKTVRVLSLWRDSRIKFGIGRDNAVIFSDRVVRRPQSTEYSFAPFKSAVLDGVCATNDSTRSKDADFKCESRVSACKIAN